MPLGPTPAPSGGSGTHTLTSFAGMRVTLCHSRTWAASSLACHSSGHGIRCANAPSFLLVGWARAGQGRADPDPLSMPPRYCCALGLQCAWTPPAPTPQPPPPTSTTLSCGRPSTSLSSCPTGICASEVLWLLVAWGDGRLFGLWASERFPGILQEGLLAWGTMGTGGESEMLYRTFAPC